MPCMYTRTFFYEQCQAYMTHPALCLTFILDRLAPLHGQEKFMGFPVWIYTHTDGNSCVHL